MNWQYWTIALLFVSSVACGDNKASFVNNDSPNNGTTANSNNVSTNTGSNGSNNGSTGTNASNNSTTHETTNMTTGVDDIYDTMPEPDNRDYDGDIPTRPADQVEAFVYDMVEAYCEKVVICRTDYIVAQSLLQRGIANKGDCMRDFFNRNPLVGYSNSVATGRSQFFVDDAPFCATQIASSTCGEVAAAYDSPRAFFQACQDGLTGLYGLYDPCGSNADCAAGSYCKLGVGTTCDGICVEPTLPEVYCGESGTVRCAEDEYCDYNDFACKTYRAVGESCSESYQCDLGNFCHDGTCAPIKLGYQLGQNCNYYSNLCSMGLFCDTSNGNGVCEELREVTQPCEALSDCVYEARCDGQVCVAKLDEGLCSFSSDCLSAQCQEDGQCLSTTSACILPEVI